MRNTNYDIGLEAEYLFSESIAEQSEIIELLKSEYSIDGDFLDATVKQERARGRAKRDVRLLFDCGSNIDASIKAYGADSNYNQLTRWTVDNFAKYFGLSDDVREDLRELILAKCRNPRKVLLFPLNKRKMYEDIIKPIIAPILKESFSNNSSREILVLFDENEGIMRIWKMEEVLDRISHTISYSSQGGNMVIGGCVYLQRKGGNGQHIKVPRTSPDHPGNQIQPKLHTRDFIDLHHQSMLAEYNV
ncbi:MAG: hypothetical protein OXU27_03145 [Candidatus Poribacteria bacterium]|nr:hypothetical protein [Candidatus Poribacteria bacterium]